MKKTLTIIACALCLSLAQAQHSYQSVFGDTVTMWAYVFQENISRYSNIAAVFKHTLPDTAVWGGLSYRYVRLVYHQHTRYVIDTFNFITAPFSPGSDFGLRESEDHSRLYRRTDENSAEILIMDLNWQVGDTIVLWDHWLGQHQDTATIDSIYYVDGRKHLRTTHYLKFRMDDYPAATDTLCFIEGIGPTRSIAPFEMSHVFVPLLSCQQKDGNDIWNIESSFPAWEDWQESLDCYPPLYEDGIDTAHHATQVSVYPTPTTGTVHLRGLPDETVSAHIFDAHGSMVLSVVLAPGRHELDLSCLPRGVYFLNVNKLASSMIKLIKI